MLRFHCTHCDRRLSVPESKAGKKGKCPSCGGAIVVPAAPAAAAAPRKPQRPSDDSLPPIMKASYSSGETEEMIDMTAMVDIVFFLLIFFMVTSLVAKQASIAMPPPPPATETAATSATPRTLADYEADDDFIIVRIDADNAIYVDEKEARNEHDVIAAVREIAEATGGVEERGVLVVGHPDAEHGTAVMVMDAVRDAGVSNVRLSVTAEE